jgi:hydrogenase maturation protease
MSRTDPLVIGLGHPYRSDDGVGPRVIELLADRRPAGLSWTASTGEPAELIEAWESSDTVIIVDALCVPDAEPGRVHHLLIDPGRVTDLDLPASASTHGFELGQTLDLAQALNRLPARIVLYAIEVADVSFGDHLSAPVAVAARSVADQLCSDHGQLGPQDRPGSTGTGPDAG